MGDERATIAVSGRRGASARATPAAKPVPRFDATKHGLLTRAMLLDDGAQKESATELRRLHAQLHAELAPEGIDEEILVERILACYWRLRRLLAAERGLIRRQADHAALHYHLALVDAHKRRLENPFTKIDDLLVSSHGAKHIAKVMRDCLENLDEQGVIGGWAWEALEKLFRHDILIEGEKGEFAFLLMCQGHLEKYAAGEPDGDGEERPTKAQCLGMLRHMLGSYLERAETLHEGTTEWEGHRAAAEALASVLPPAGDGERLLRHEAALEGQLYRALRELRELQRERLARAGQVPEATRPLTVHVGTVEVGLHAAPPSGADGQE